MNSSHCFDSDKVDISTNDSMEEQSEHITAMKDPDKFNLIHFIKTRIIICIICVLSISITLTCIILVATYERNNDVTSTIDAWKEKLSAEQTVWFDHGLNELKNALKVEYNKKRARNVILFVGDGLGPSTLTASRIFKGGEESSLTWENFAHMGLLKTYCMDKQVPDSTSTATALFGGVKANYETGGVDAGVSLANCSASLDKIHHVDSIIEWALEAGMKTGFVTTTRVVHATPSVLYAAVADRRWECEANMPEDAKNLGCKDIARQLVEDWPGRDIHVIMGGGRQCLVSDVVGSVTDPLDTWSCVSKDGRDLISDWKRDKLNRSVKHAVVENTEELNSLNISKPDYVMGIFANGHLMYEHERDKGPKGMPSLKEMTSAAIELLMNDDNGFVLVVEGGMIDQATHRGFAKTALTEVLALDEAVEESIKLMKDKLDETLIIVTSDHSDTLSISGYAKKGNDIFGVAQNSKFDGVPYTTLTYATGHDGYQVEVDADGNAHRRDPTLEDTTAYNYMQQVGIKTDEGTHGGVDVSVHAMGPMAHLFHKVHEQSYVAHVISYAARLGRFSDKNIFRDIF